MRKVLLIALALAVGSGVANASTISVQTTPAGATAIAGLVGATVQTFEGVTPGSYSTLTLGGVTFTAGASTVFYIDSSYAGQYNNFGQSLQNKGYANAFGTLTMTSRYLATTAVGLQTARAQFERHTAQGA
jgi:hypothetical protein